jgi:plasmid segregation protein ParM
MKSRIQLIGLDLGFGFTKGFDGQQPVIIPSALSDHGQTETEAATERQATERGFHMLVDEKACFVGQRADGDWRSPQRPRQPERLFGDFGKHLVLAALAVYAEMENPLHVVLGLPVQYFQRFKKPFEERLIGYHRAAWLQPDGSRTPKNIHIRKIHTVPHPMGTYSGLILDADGQMRADAFKDRKIVLVDIGFRSTNVLMMDRMRFSNRFSGTIDLGISRGLETIDRKLHMETGHHPRFDQLYQAVRLGYIRIEGQTYNLERLKEETFSRLAAELADHIGHMLAPAWDLDSLLLTGGGARELAAHIGPRLPGDVSLIENEQDIRLNNAQGQWRLARSLWGLSGLCEKADGQDERRRVETAGNGKRTGE